MDEIDYELIGRFIFTSFRYGGELQDAADWFADTLKVPHIPAPEITADVNQLYCAYLRSFANETDAMANYRLYEEFMSARLARGATCDVSTQIEARDPTSPDTISGK